MLLTSGGVRAAIGVFVKPLEAEFGWSRTALSFAVAVSIALYGLTGPLVARLADRWGPRWVLTGCVALVGIGTMLGAGVTQFWQFFVAAASAPGRPASDNEGLCHGVGTTRGAGGAGGG